MILIKTITELQQYLNVDSTFDIDKIAFSQNDAIEDFLREAIGDDLTTELVSWYKDLNEESEPVPPFQALLPYAQRVVAKFAFMLATPNLDLKLMDAGFAVVSNNDLVPASKDRVNRFQQQLEVDGWNAVEQLLRFLEKNKDKYPLWTESDAYTMHVRNFINSAEEFDKIIPINKSRLKFRELRAEMDNVEILQVIPVMGEDMAEEIKEQLKDNNLSPQNKRILPVIRRAVANLVAARVNILGNNQEKIKHLKTTTAAGNQIPQSSNHVKGDVGERFLSELRRMLDSAPDDYPLYRDSLYVANRNYQKFENGPEYGIFVAGS